LRSRLSAPQGQREPFRLDLEIADAFGASDDVYEAGDALARGDARRSIPLCFAHARNGVAAEGLLEITATTMGTFYSRPSPDAEPFVAVGSRIDPETTVGLIEVMKLFNGVAAGVTGTVEQICVEDAQLVEDGQVLVRVRPDA
jgi:acetyl-CoA carboxylase biotin carboxyl carrier protein